MIVNNLISIIMMHLFIFVPVFLDCSVLKFDNLRALKFILNSANICLFCRPKSNKEEVLWPTAHKCISYSGGTTTCCSYVFLGLLSL